MMRDCNECEHSNVCYRVKNKCTDGCLDFKEKAMCKKCFPSEIWAMQDIRHKEVLYSLCDMVLQFAYETTFYRKDALSNAGLSALERAFYTLEDSGLKINSNGTIQVHNLIDFMSKIEKKKAEAEAALTTLNKESRINMRKEIACKRGAMYS